MPPRPRPRAPPLPPSSSIFLCPSCTHWRLSRAPQLHHLLPRSAQSLSTTTRRRPLRPPPTPRSALPPRCQAAARLTTSSSTAAINAPPSTPPALRGLHAALENLRRVGPEFVNLSLVGLALRGVEGGAAGGRIRVAVLGFGGGGVGARALARMLVADTLGAGRDSVDGGDGPVLLRYGGEGGGVLMGGSRLCEEMVVPSTLLLRHGIEILVSTLSADVAVAAGGDRPSDAILVPTLEAGRAGRVTMVRYPVHKAVVLGRGLGDCARIGAFMAGEGVTEERKGLITFAVDLPGLAAQRMPVDSSVYGVTAVDLDAAEQALQGMRGDTQKGAGNDAAWLRSGLPVLRQWLLDGVPAADTNGHPALKPALRSLISHILTTASSALDTAALSSPPQSSPSAARSAQIETLQDALVSWSRQAHTELRDSLDEAFQSRNWAKITWWKLLLGRVDDVTMVAEEVLERRWLLSAEKSGLWLMGRLDQASLLPANSATGKSAATPPSDAPPDIPTAMEPVAPAHTATDNPVAPAISVSSISQARSALGRATVPQLQATAQRLLLETLSTASLTSSLAALLWLSSSSSAFEASSVAALGAVWALRRLQRGWEARREAWGAEVREQGRLCLRSVELGVGHVLERAAVAAEGPVEDGMAGPSSAAREAVGRVREELERLR